MKKSSKERRDRCSNYIKMSNSQWIAPSKIEYTIEVTFFTKIKRDLRETKQRKVIKEERKPQQKKKEKAIPFALLLFTFIFFFSFSQYFSKGMSFCESNTHCNFPYSFISSRYRCTINKI